MRLDKKKEYLTASRFAERRAGRAALNRMIWQTGHNIQSGAAGAAEETACDMVVPAEVSVPSISSA